jgi:hypothetical protein
MKRMSRNYALLAVLILYLVIIKVYIQSSPGSFRSIQQAQVFDWMFLGIWALLGMVGMWFYEKCELPAFGSINTTNAVLHPSLVGLAMGILAVTNDQLTHWTDYVATQMSLSTIHIDFPQSLLLYPGGAIVHEIFNRLFLIPLLLWVFGFLLFKKRHNETIFWSVAVFTSLIEPWGDLGLVKLGWLTMISSFTLDFVLNLSQAYYFRRAGVLSSILLRISFYLVWHVLYGAWLQFQ